MSQVQVKACDNEMFLVASGTNSSATICHIQSGYHYAVNVIINIKKGNEYSACTEIDGLSGPVNKTINFTVPVDEVYISPMCINWSGPYDFQVEIDGKLYEKNGNSSTPLGLVLGDIVEDGGSGVKLKL